MLCINLIILPDMLVLSQAGLAWENSSTINIKGIPRQYPRIIIPILSITKDADFHHRQRSYLLTAS
jgi:hypothetical protein